MSNNNMLPSQRILLCTLLLGVNILSIESNNLATKFSIVLKTPDNKTLPTELPHKSVHVKYTLQSDTDQWNIVGFEPQIQLHQNAVEQLTVHICDSIIYRSIWYDDLTVCDNTQSMLIYEWTPYSTLSSFHLSDDCGFEFNKFKSIILTVIYRKEKRIHKEQSGIILYISTQPTRFHMGTMRIGDKQKGKYFSCRSSTYPRLLYAMKKLTIEKKHTWWRIYVIRIRQFGRKSVQSVFNSDNILNRNQTNIEIVSSDIFIMSGDYLLVECENISQSNCYFLIYYMYKSKLNLNENTCENNEYPNLFKLIPLKQLPNTKQTITKTSNMDGSTIFLIIGILLFIIWISIIIGCIIMRRIRGLVNFRTEPPSSTSAQKNRLLGYARRGVHDNFNTRTGDADHIMQIDGEHAGFAS